MDTLIQTNLIEVQLVEMNNVLLVDGGDCFNYNKYSLERLNSFIAEYEEMKVRVYEYKDRLYIENI